ncbi:MAG: hypothetical protein DRO87_12660 [Candidatus Thorarchaeota archaeon]|nr:MAG: hypothetical protein DRO87_12660 [Candidatus Thorarchaeota archaeon]RLI58182.1 MAG: hypothetical protein DRP09_00135 [Candidatus Thorarchaeota archaeon]
MSKTSMPWSFYATLASFAIFFASLNIYVLTSLISHPMASPLWLVGVAVGLVALVYSVRMVRIHQAELVALKREREEREEMQTQ